MISKGLLLIISGVIGACLILIGVFGTYALCNNNDQCINVLHFFFLHFLPLAFVLLFSLMTYWMRDEIYRAWFKFARWWIPLSMLLILISPEYSNDFMFPIVKGTVALMTSAVFALASIVIIGLAYFRKR